MKIADSLGMTIIKTVSMWYSLFLLFLLSPAHAESPPGPNKSPVIEAPVAGVRPAVIAPNVFQPSKGIVTTGLSKDADPTPTPPPPPTNSPTSGVGLSSPAKPAETIAYPNMSKSLVDKATKRPKNRVEKVEKAEAQEVLKSDLNFPKTYTTPTQTGYSKPDQYERQHYEYRPEPGAFDAKPVDNNFPKTCDIKHQSIPFNPAGVNAESLRGHPCKASDDRMTCMVCNLFHEAANEPAVGQLAVAQVVMTRMFEAFRPATVCGVVWEKSQFSWTMLNHDDALKLPYNTEQLQHLIDVAQQGMCLGPNGKNHYYNPGPNCKPDWGRGDCSPSKTQNYLGGGQHLFCTIGSGQQTRSIEEVRRAEGGLQPLNVSNVSKPELRSPAARR